MNDGKRGFSSNNTELDAMDIYDKLYSIKVAGRFFMDSVELILMQYEKNGVCPVCSCHEGAGVLYSFIKDKLTKTMEIFNQYEK